MIPAAPTSKMPSLETRPPGDGPLPGNAPGGGRSPGKHAAGRVVATALVAWLLLGAGSALAEVDPFYQSLLREGVDAAARNDLAPAEKSLRLACFGFLDDLDLLSECLVRLALVETRSGDLDGFRQTFRRVLEIEDRFGAYSKAPLPADLRQSFEGQAALHVPDTLLDASAAFRPLVDQKLLARLETLPPAQRRQALEERIRSAPEEPRWRLRLARLELDEERPAAALTALDGLSSPKDSSPKDSSPKDPAQLDCLRSEARLASGDCAAADELSACPRAKDHAKVAAGVLECWSAQARWQDAEAFLSQLEPAVQGRRELERYRRRIERELRQARAAEPVAAPETSDGAPAAEEPASETQTAPASEAQPLPAEGQQRLQKARQLLATARLASDLDEAFTLATEVADAHPDSRSAQFLAAEIAYRSSRWTEAAAYFRRGGDPGDAQPVLLFFMAVSLYESGDRVAAAEALQRSLPLIQRSDYVDRYAEKILGPGTKPGAAP